MEKIWKKVEKINFLTCSELLEELKRNNFKVSPWIEDIVKKNNYKFNNNKFPIKLEENMLGNLVLTILLNYK